MVNSLYRIHSAEEWNICLIVKLIHCQKMIKLPRLIEEELLLLLLSCSQGVAACRSPCPNIYIPVLPVPLTEVPFQY
jgi:hypothetical protein